VGDVQEAKSILFVQTIARIAVAVTRARHPDLVAAHEAKLRTSGTLGGAGAGGSGQDVLDLPTASPLPSLTTSSSSGSLNSSASDAGARTAKKKGRKYYEMSNFEAALLEAPPSESSSSSASSSSSSSSNPAKAYARPQVIFAEPDVLVMMSMLSDMDDAMIAGLTKAVCNGIQATCHFNSSPSVLPIRAQPIRWMGCWSCFLCCEAFGVYEFGTSQFESYSDDIVAAALRGPTF
jgi:hypothetical protein